MNDDLYGINERMQKSIEIFKEELAGIRAGRANPIILDKISVNYYGVPTPLKQVSNISVSDARTLVIQPWDVSLLKEIEKEIQKSDIGINPTNDGKVIRLTFPPLTEERRLQLKKEVERKSEECKVAIRSIRRDAIEKAKADKKNGKLTEDDLRDIQDEIQEVTDKYIKKIDEITEAKSKEIMEI